MELKQDILQKISKDCITPKPKWMFTVCDYGMWIAMFLFIIFGGFASAVIIYMLEENDWDLHEHLSDSTFGFIISTLPYLWIVSLLILLAIALYSIKHTKHGYRHHTLPVLGLVIFISSIMGVTFYSIGFGETLNEKLGNNVPGYKTLFDQREKRLTNPDKGLLVGKVIAATSSEYFVIRNPQVGTWKITIDNNTMILSTPTKRFGVRIVGSVTNDSNKEFHAVKILPLTKTQLDKIQRAKNVLEQMPPRQKLDLIKQHNERLPEDMRINVQRAR